MVARKGIRIEEVSCSSRCGQGSGPAVVALVALCAFASVASAPTVFIKDGKKGLRFEAPKTIADGEELAVVNLTNPHKVGPHTFSLVTKGSIPTTPKGRQLCFTPHHICKAIAGWHGVKGNGPPKENPAEAGPGRLEHDGQPEQEGRLVVHR